jgi:hypothetical protein
MDRPGSDTGSMRSFAPVAATHNREIPSCTCIPRGGLVVAKAAELMPCG